MFSTDYCNMVVDNDPEQNIDLRTASEKAGLNPIEDGGHIIIVCSNCRKSLVDIWLTHQEMPVISTIIAHCGYCGDKSFEQEIAGIFHLGPVDGVSISDTQTIEPNKYNIITKV